MNPNAVEALIAKALTTVDGSVLAAKRLLVKWVQADPDMLRLFVQPHLEAIIGRAVDQVVNTHPPAAARPAAAAVRTTPPPPKAITPAVMNQLIGQLGQAAGDSPIKPGGKASQEATMRALAQAFEKKRKEK